MVGALAAELFVRAVRAPLPEKGLGFGAADGVGVPLQGIQGALVAIAPVVGSTRVVTA
ncbi:hypothetical protein ACIBTP_39665 [Streptomyces avidinii]|uniref:hypothetical protein n=1 Tax=Streptomyces TaxID=1883 RepID=UPI000F42E72B|nr:hypothetical protein [Streptomyces sp. ADI95-16]AYV26378.1 hypothetical protein EES41_06545 [Streptomyces sp. ADI95-16]